MLRIHDRLVCLAFPTALLVATAVCPSQSAAQVVVFNSNGFESPTFSAGNLTGQQGFQALPGGPAATVQTATVSAGTQALQINGAQLQENVAFGNANFWYKSYSVAAAVNPVASGNPIVRVNFSGRISGALGLPSDIPFGGAYLEGYTASGNPLDQQAITPILLNLNNGISVFTTFALGGSDGTISTADAIFGREAWNDIEAQLDFSTQTFRVLLNGTPVTFTEGTFSGINVPFRNSNGPTVSIAELGFQGYYNASFQPTLNNMYFDNFSVIATPVPEPSTLALTGLALSGFVAHRRRRRK